MLHWNWMDQTQQIIFCGSRYPFIAWGYGSRTKIWGAGCVMRLLAYVVVQSWVFLTVRKPSQSASATTSSSVSTSVSGTFIAQSPPGVGVDRHEIGYGRHLRASATRTIERQSIYHQWRSLRLSRHLRDAKKFPALNSVTIEKNLFSNDGEGRRELDKSYALREIDLRWVDRSNLLFLP